MKKFLCAIGLSILTAISFAGESTGTPTSATFTVYDYNSAPILNPDKGIAGYVATSDLIAEGVNTCCYASTYEATYGSRVMLCPFNLQSYVNSNFDSTFLASYDARLATMRSLGIQCQLAHSYDNFSGSGVDASMTQIVAHINQLGPIWKKYADVIPFQRASFIGAYGETWGSKNGNSCGYQATLSNGTAISNCTTDPNAAAVLTKRQQWRDALIANVPPYTLLGFRYPSDIHFWYPTVLSASQAWSGSPQSHITGQNDCPLGVTSLTGSTTDDNGGWIDNYLGASVSTLQTYISQLNSFYGYIGEMSQSCGAVISDCTHVVAYMKFFHVQSFKAIGSDGAPYISGITSGGCANEVYNRMGYFLSLDNVTHQSTANRGDNITVTIQLHNNGYARLSTPRTVTAQACLVAAPNTCYTGVADSDLRLLPSQTTTPSTVQAHITIPVGATTGAYQIRLSVPSVFAVAQGVRAFMIHFANTNGSGTQAWNDAGGYMVTGTTLTVN